MTFLSALTEFLLCVGAVLAFCVLINTPKKTVLCSSVISGLAYVMYRLIFVGRDARYLLISLRPCLSR